MASNSQSRTKHQVNHPSERSSRPRDRKAQLAIIAAELFRASGFHGVGINDIAAAANITGPALYRHFSDKQSVLAYVVLSGIAEMEAATSTYVDKSSTPASQQIDALLRGLAKQAIERRDIAALWRWEGRNLSTGDQQEVRKRSRKLLASWTGLLCLHRPELTEPEAEVLCWAALSVFGSVSVHQLSLPKNRFVDLLATLSRRVLHAKPFHDTTPETDKSAIDSTSSTSRRNLILTAAAELFAHHGFRAVSMEDIGVASGIAGPSVYRHFTSKAALLNALCQRATSRLTIGMEHVLKTRPPLTYSKALSKLVESYVDSILTAPELTVALSADTTALSASEQADLLGQREDYLGHWTQLLVEAQPGLSDKEALITAHAALTIANDLVRTGRVRARNNLAGELTKIMRETLAI